MGACKPCTRRAGERLKCVLQIQESPSYKGTKYNGYKELVNGLYKEGGVSSICRGSGITSLAPYPLHPIPHFHLCSPRARPAATGVIAARKETTGSTLWREWPSTVAWVWRPTAKATGSGLALDCSLAVVASCSVTARGFVSGATFGVAFLGATFGVCHVICLAPWWQLSARWHCLFFLLLHVRVPEEDVDSQGTLALALALTLPSPPPPF